MKYEFRLLNDILAKAVTVKAGSFDAVTIERFQMMTAIHYGLKVNWGKVLFTVLKDMVDKSQRKAKGFAAQIGVLLKGIPVVTLGEGVLFPFAKILSMKTVNSYIATNTTIDAREKQGMIGEATVKRKSNSTKQSSSADNTPVKVISEVAGSSKRVATEDIAPVIPTKRRTVKTKHSSSQASLDIMPVAQDVVPIQELVKDTDNAAAKTTDEVDIIIEQVLEETLMLGVNEEEHGGQGVDDTMFTEDFAQWLDDFVSRNSAPEIAGAKNITEVAGSTSPVVVKDINRAVSSIFTNEELMSIDDLLLQISDDMLLPSITATEITKIHLGESVSITEYRECDVHLTSLPRISTHDKGKAILEEDEPIRGNPARELQRAHGLPMEQPCASSAFDSSVVSDAILAQFYSLAKSTCWVRPMILIDGIWKPLQGPNYLKSGWHLSLFLNQKKMPKPAIADIFALHVSLVEPVQYWEAAPYLIKTWRWAQVCADIVLYSMFGCLKLVRVLPCTDITVYNLGVERIPADFLSMFAQGMACHNFVDSVVQRDSRDLQEVDITGDEEVDLVSSDVSTVYRSPSPIFQEVDSVEHDLQFALGPAIFPSVAQEERLYFLQSPASSLATYQPQESSSSSTDVSIVSIEKFN
ncbi:hypothetical protein F511_34499 [Dorcoceras hygrometricum]|uniref:Uncharacterized protein n=1 Tax=Dorcoceras hygrometricum TaxID=472368 RepID=A0A2Z7ADK3_9LAMI|nr:hypothetical protein F511_34499 [Dorcoceras hygrometricum]